jgi:hypothetical protein
MGIYQRYVPSQLRALNCHLVAKSRIAYVVRVVADRPLSRSMSVHRSLRGWLNRRRSTCGRNERPVDVIVGAELLKPRHELVGLPPVRFDGDAWHG